MGQQQSPTSPLPFPARLPLEDRAHDNSPRGRLTTSILAQPPPPLERSRMPVSRLPHTRPAPQTLTTTGHGAGEQGTFPDRPIMVPTSLPPMPLPLPNQVPVAGQPIGVATTPTQSKQGGGLDCASQQPWLVHAWNRRHQCVAMLVSLVFFMGGLAVALVLFFWFRGVHRSYYSTDLQRTCLSLGDSLALDISTNLVTFVDDIAGYAATEPNLNNATVSRFTSLAVDHSEEADGISFVAVLARHRKLEWERQFSTTLVDGNDTFTRLSLLAPITYRVILPPLRNPIKNPIGFNMYQSGEYALSVRRTLGDGRPSLVVAEPGTAALHPPNKRVWIAKGVKDVPVPNFPVWVITLLVDSQRSVSRTLAPGDRTHGFHVRLVDNSSTSEIYVSQSPSNSVLLPTDTAIATFPVVDRNWTLTCTGTHTLRGAFNTPWSWVLFFLIMAVFTVSSEITRRAVIRFLTARGIARQVKHREGLVASLRMYSRAIVSTVRDPLMALDPLGYLVGSNKEALERLGIQGSNGSSVHISSLLPPQLVNSFMVNASHIPRPPPIPRQEDWDSVYSLGDGENSTLLPLEPLPPGSYEIGTVGRPSSTFMAEATVSQPTTAERGEVSQVILLHDITERIRTMQVLQAAQDAAKTASVAKSQLLLLISHELRNPIYVIDTLVEEVTASASAAATLKGGWNGAVINEAEFVAAARIQHTTRLVADILANLVDLFADSTAAEAKRLAEAVAAAAVPPGRAWHSGPGKQLLSLANSALASVHPQLDMWDVAVERWISPEWVLHGPTGTVERLLSKLAYIIAHATRPCGQTVLEILVHSQSQELRVYCRGDMWIPAENSSQLVASTGGAPPRGVSADGAGGVSVGIGMDGGKHTRAAQHDRPSPWQPDRIPAPEHIDPLTHAVLFLAIGSVCAMVFPMQGSLLRCQFSKQYGGLDVTIPLGSIRARRMRCLVNDLGVPAKAETARASFTEEAVSIKSSMSLPNIASPARSTLGPLLPPLDSPPRHPVSSSPDVYPSPISPDRVLPNAPPSLFQQSFPKVAASHEDGEANLATVLTPCHSRVPSLTKSSSSASSPSPAPRTLPRPPPNSRQASRMASLMMAVRTMIPPSPSPTAGTQQPPPSPTADTHQPSLPLLKRAVTAPAKPHHLVRTVSAEASDPFPQLPCLDTLPFHTPLPSSPMSSVKSLGLPEDPVPPAIEPPRITHASVPTPALVQTPALLDGSPTVPSMSPSNTCATVTHDADPNNSIMRHVDPSAVQPTATIDSPAQAVPHDHSAPPHAVHPSTAKQVATDSKYILIVEDNALVLRVTSKLVKTLGYEPDTATDGLECVQRMKDGSKPKVDLILMDLVMPNMDGHEAMKTLREDGFTKDKMPIVAVTANALPEERDKCLEAGFNGFLAKPLKKDMLVEICRRFILVDT